MRYAPLLIAISMLPGCMTSPQPTPTPSPTPSPSPAPMQEFHARGAYTGQVSRNLGISELDANDGILNNEARADMIEVTVTFDDSGRLLNESGQPVALGDVLTESFNGLNMTLIITDLQYSTDFVVVTTQATALVGENDDRMVAGELPIVYRMPEGGGEGIECVNEGTLNEAGGGDTHFRVFRGLFGTLSPVANP